MTERERERKPGRDISYCIDASYHKGTNTTLKSRRQLVMEVRALTEARTEEAKKQRREHQKNGKDYCSRRGKVLVPRKDEVSNCITANNGKEHLVMEEHTVAYSKSHRETHIDARGKIDGEANTLNTGDGCVSQSTGNYVVTKEEDMGDIKFVGGINPKKTWNKEDDRSLSRNYSQGERVHSPEGLSPCLSANMGGTANGSQLIVEESNIRIRKLTPLECERLQGYPDDWTSKGINDKGEVVGISNTQRYKMCGNGISSPVPSYLFPKIFGSEHIRVMSLFSGCGGTELSLPDNFEVVGHCEFDKYASSVLRYHYPNIPNFHDVTEFVDKEVPEFDMLVGGFPCQSWSIAGLRKGFSDERGQLIYNVFDILRKHKPRLLVLENVKGLLSKDKGDAFEAIMEYLSELGYELDFEVVNSKNFGLAQNRERVFIFGKLSDVI